MVDKMLHSQMPFTTGKQTINDRLTAAYHSLAGSQLGKTVCKATTEEEIGPKKKHLDYLLHCTNEPNVSIPQLANLLLERVTSTNWCTVFKALISIHNLMCYGNERFSQYLASSNANFNLNAFLDKTSLQGYDMSNHVRRYAKYVGAKVYTYRLMAFDFCKVKRGREDGLLRTMPTDRLLKTLPLLQDQIDTLLEFQVSQTDLTNGVINSCFILMFRDLIRLFACYNDAIINLLEKYFDMNKKQCREALDLYKGFLARMDRVAEFLKVAESVGIDKSEIPDLARAPGSLIEALEQHLAALEGSTGQPRAPSGPGSRVTSPTTNEPGTAAQHAISRMGGFSAAASLETSIDEQMRRRILDEEEQRLNTMKEQRLRELNTAPGGGGGGRPPAAAASAPKTNNPFLQAPAVSSAQSSSIDDLLSLDFGSPAPAPAAAFPAAPAPAPFGNPFNSSLLYGSQAPAFGAGPAHANGHNPRQAPFASDDAFARAFDAPTQGQRAAAKPVAAGGVLKGDLDSSLASLAQNLNISKGQEALKNKPVQWNQNQQQRPLPNQQQQYAMPLQQQQIFNPNPMQYNNMYQGYPAMAGGGYGAPAPFGQPRPPTDPFANL